MSLIQLNYKEKRAYRTCKRASALEVERKNFQSLWSDVGRLICPNKNNIFQSRMAGEKKTQDLFDSTGTRFNRELANGLYYLASNPTNRWYGFSTGIKELDEDSDVRKFLYECEEVQTDIMNRSNFHTEVHSTYEDLPSFGTGVFFTMEDDAYIVKYMAKQIYDCVIAEDAFGRVNEIYVYYMWTLRQIVAEYGKDWMNEEIKREYELVLNGGVEKQYKVIYGIMPWSGDFAEEKERPSASYKYFAHFVLEKCKLEIKQENYEVFPAAVPRFVKLAGEVYGRCPGIDTIPDMATLNAMKKVVLMGGQLAIAPPVQMVDGSATHPMRWKPFGVNYRRPGSEEIKPIGTGANPQIGLDIMASIKEDLGDSFFIPQLRLIQQDRMTAEEVRTRKDEMYRSLGAALGRVFTELLGPTVEQTFNISAKKNVFPKVPEKLANIKRMNIKYTSMIARAQASIKGEALNRALQASATILQSNPMLLQIVNGEKAFRKNLDTYGVDHDIINSESEYKEIVEAQTAQAEKDKQLEEENIQSETDKNTMTAAASGQ